jgi:hypothetical protein
MAFKNANTFTGIDVQMLKTPSPFAVTKETGIANSKLEIHKMYVQKMKRYINSKIYYKAVATIFKSIRFHASNGLIT